MTLLFSFVTLLILIRRIKYAKWASLAQSRKPLLEGSPTKMRKKKQFVTGNDILREKCFYFILNGFHFCFMLLKK